MNTSKKPAPVVNEWARPFWDFAKERKLYLQECITCSKHIFYPRIACPFCGSQEIEWVQASGKGKLYTFTVVENNAPSAFQSDCPYVVAIVQLEEGVQMLTNIVDCNPYKLKFDMPVEVTFDQLNDEFTLPKFKPIND